MDLRQIEYVEAVAKHANFTRAAAELHVAQPALSVAVRRLEAELGVRLFARTSRRVTLTDAGAAFLGRATRLRREVDDLSREMREYASGSRGQLRVSVWYHIEPRLVQMGRELLAATPSGEIVLSELGRDDALAALRDGTIDLAMIDLRDDEEVRGVEHVVVRREPYVLVTPPGHPLATRDSVTIADLVEEPFIAPGPGSPLRRWYDDLIVGGTRRPRVAVETSELAAVVALVSAGMGCAALSAAIVAPIGYPVGIVPISDAPQFVLGVAWTNRPHTPLVQRAIDMARRDADKLPQALPVP
jgi:DNA-binding transcriptional LysR family regulator